MKATEHIVKYGDKNAAVLSVGSTIMSKGWSQEYGRLLCYNFLMYSVTCCNLQWHIYLWMGVGARVSDRGYDRSRAVLSYVRSKLQPGSNTAVLYEYNQVLMNICIHGIK